MFINYKATRFFFFLRFRVNLTSPTVANCRVGCKRFHKHSVEGPVPPPAPRRAGRTCTDAVFVCMDRGPQRILEGGRRRAFQQQQQRLLELERPQRPVQPVHAVAAAVGRQLQARPQPRAAAAAGRRHRRGGGQQPAL